MQTGHLEATKERLQADTGDYLLVAQDRTSYNDSGQWAMAGLGKIQGHVKGIRQHNLLALSETGMPLGLLGQEYWWRESWHPYEGEKESEKWGKGLALVNRELVFGDEFTGDERRGKGTVDGFLRVAVADGAPALQAEIGGLGGGETPL